MNLKLYTEVTLKINLSENNLKEGNIATLIYFMPYPLSGEEGMEVKTNTVEAQGIKFTIEENDRIIARAYLYIMHNDLHRKPFGLLEDVYVDENNRGQGLGTKLVKRVIAAAKDRGCYKLIATSRKSRFQVHQLYNRLGFQEYGWEFRIDL